MPKNKIPRKSTSIDMTAMCDVAFLLLTFFMLTTKFKPEEPVSVDTPTSVSTTILPTTNVAMLLVDKEGKVFFDVLGRDNREKVLTTMLGKYKIGLDENMKRQFLIGSAIGCPMADLPTWMSKPAEARKDQPGVPIDSLDNQVADWVTASLYIDPNFPFVIKADRETEYPKIKKVMDVLQKQNINKFSLITGIEALPIIEK